jgi:hypothetical protein
MQNARLPVAESVSSFELKASPDSPGMANLRINCLVSIPTGIRILALIDAEESKPENREAGDGAIGEKALRGRKRRNGANLEE